jgi:serine/threonine protein kinase
VDVATDSALSHDTLVDRTLLLRKEVKACPECNQRFSAEATFCPFDGSTLALSRYEPPVDPLVGTTVDGRYEVIGVLGEGGMGTVYEVRHKMLGRAFAMKLLRRDIAREEDLAARFINEAKATGSIKHPHIVSITDFGRLDDSTPYFVMELLVGQTLAQVLKAEGSLDTTRARAILLQLASALAQAHSSGVIHRDLKPENVFLARPAGGALAAVQDDVKIVDFGAAKILGSSRITKTGIVFGTPHYMSPEQASGQPVDHRADIYALGVIMYEILTGRVPFEAETYMGVLTQHMFVRPKPPSTVRPDRVDLGGLEDITLRALEKKPEDRYQTMHGLAADLEKTERGESVARSVRPSSLRPPSGGGTTGPGTTTRPRERVPLPAGVGGSATLSSAALVGALVGLLAVGVFLLLRGRTAGTGASSAHASPPPSVAALPAYTGVQGAALPPATASQAAIPAAPPATGVALASASSPSPVATPAPLPGARPVASHRTTAATPPGRAASSAEPAPRRSSTAELSDPWAK